MAKNWDQERKNAWMKDTFGFIPSKEDMLSWAKVSPGEVELVAMIMNPRTEWKKNKGIIKGDW